MIGNDVVDLSDPETPASQLNPRFDQRIFTADELQRLAHSRQPHRLRWLLWAAKEASYKSGRKTMPDLVFSPRRFATRKALAPTPAKSIVGPQLGETDVLQVDHPDGNYKVKILSGPSHVHALATPITPSLATVDVVATVFRLDDAPLTRPSDEIRQRAIAYLAPFLDMRASRLQIVTRRKIPYLLGPEGEKLGDLSLSHHGRFLAIAFQALTSHSIIPPVSRVSNRETQLLYTH